MSSFGLENEAATLARRSGDVKLLEIGEKGMCPACGCVGPNPGYIKLTKEELDVEMATLKGDFWVLSDDSLNLKRTFKCRNWQAAVDFINAASVIAEREDISHHPDLHITMYRNVEVVLWTHAAGGLTAYDFKLARGIETIQVDYSPKWLQNHPSSQI